MGTRRVLAVAAHPDDIEMMMSGTLLLLRDAGWELHYMNIGNGSCGTATESAHAIVAERTAEAEAACRLVGATFHAPLCNDLEVYHNYRMVARVLAVVRQVEPSIMLIPSPQDYMEDHMQACRLAVTAAFSRGLRNYISVPPMAPVAEDVTLYHAMPHGLRGPLRERVHAGQYADVTDVMAEKRAMLACHKSQKEWLDRSQGLDAYLDTMAEFAREMGCQSGCFEYAEGWRRRNHLGFSVTAADPLAAALGDCCRISSEYEEALDR